MTATCKLRSGASFTVVADAASVGSDAGSIRHEGAVIDAPIFIDYVPSPPLLLLMSLSFHRTALMIRNPAPSSPSSQGTLP